MAKSSSGDFVKVFGALDIVQAQIVSARLADLGIPAMIDQESFSKVYPSPFPFGLTARIDVKVPLDDKVHALEALIDLGYLEEEEPDEEG